jgi:HD-GYP domain-containing protein (c-di-GMP phosphodiesterase class II)
MTRQEQEEAEQAAYEAAEQAAYEAHMQALYEQERSMQELTEEVARLRYEVERLTAENVRELARKPDTLTYATWREMIDLAVPVAEAARVVERAAVVAWLRAEALEWDETGPGRAACRLAADIIERGEHRREEGA